MGEEKYLSTRFSCGNLKERNPLQYLCADGRITDLKDLRGLEGVVSINLAEDRDKWRALVNTMNLQVPANRVVFLS
jgi:hypothetical protein